MRQKLPGLSISFWVANSPIRSRSATPCFLPAKLSGGTDKPVGLGSKADIAEFFCGVRFVPIADLLGPWWKPDTLFSPPLGSRFVRAHLERKHLPRTTPESRRYRNSIRQVQRRVRQRHQPDLDLVFVRRHEVDAAITRKETRDRDKLHPAHRRRTRIPIRRFPFNSPLLFRHQHKVKTKLTVEHRYGLIAHFKVGVRKVGPCSKESSGHRIEHAAKLLLGDGNFFGVWSFWWRRRNLRNRATRK